MIKTTTLALLALRFMRSNSRRSVLMAIAQAPARVNLWIQRARGRAGSWKVRIPEMLIFSRIALGPGMICLASASRRGVLLVACIVLAMISDVFDGILAERWHVATEDHYRWDSRADMFFYGCVLAVAVMRYPAAFERRWVVLTVLLLAELAHHCAAAAKYGRTASYHSLLSKIWGFLMAAAMSGLIGFGLDNWLLDVTFAWGVLCNLQGLAMTLMLPKWHENVMTLFHAVRLRRGDVAAIRNRQEMLSWFV